MEGSFTDTYIIEKRIKALDSVNRLIHFMEVVFAKSIEQTPIFDDEKEKTKEAIEIIKKAVAGSMWFTKDLSEILKDIYRLFEKILAPGYQPGEDPYMVHSHFQKLKYFYLLDMSGLNDIEAFKNYAKENAAKDFKGDG